MTAAAVVELYVLGSLLPAIVAHRKGHNFLGWWLYGLCLWIVAVPHAFMVASDIGELDQRAIAQGYRRCPTCAELVRRAAVACRYCGHDLPALPPEDGARPAVFDEDGVRWEPFNRAGFTDLDGVRVTGRMVALDRKHQRVRFLPDAEPDHSQGRTHVMPTSRFHIRD